MRYLLDKLIRALIGYDLDQATFVLDEFLKRINEELSFLVRTFLHVLLGLMRRFSEFTMSIALISLRFFAIVVAVRWIATELLGRTTNAWMFGKRFVIKAMFPRGITMAVLGFLPVMRAIPGINLFLIQRCSDRSWRG